MAEEKRNVMTEEGLRKLQEQYDYLINVKRKEIINAIEHYIHDVKNMDFPSEKEQY